MRARSTWQSSPSAPAFSASCRCRRAACTAFRRSAEHRARPGEPLTAYARCKVLVEGRRRDASRRLLADVPAQRHGYGASPRQRFDLVVNDLAATAYLYREIRMTSDGTPWRPFVHLLDIARRSPACSTRPEISCTARSSTSARGATTRSARSRRSSRTWFPDAAVVRRSRPTSATTGSTSARSTTGCRASVRLGRRARGVGAARRVCAHRIRRADYRWRGYTRLEQITHLLHTARSTTTCSGAADALGAAGGRLSPWRGPFRWSSLLLQVVPAQRRRSPAPAACTNSRRSHRATQPHGRRQHRTGRVRHRSARSPIPRSTSARCRR